jgi:hypothetical protein
VTCVLGLKWFGLAEFVTLGTFLQFLELWDQSAILVKGLKNKFKTIRDWTAILEK